MDSIFTHPAKYVQDQLCFGKKPKDLRSFVHNYDGPFYLYDLEDFSERLGLFCNSVPKNSLVAFALKSNSYPGFLKKVQKLGAGVDVVSGEELDWALQNGITAEKIVFSGVAKSELELHMAIQKGVGLLNIESLSELRAVSRVAQELRKTVSIGLRMNPDLDVQTHPYISTGLKENKFGIPLEDLTPYLNLIQQQPLLRLRCLSHHLGSQMMNLEPIRESLKLFKNLYTQVKKEFPHLDSLDVGGGLGISYESQNLEIEKNNFAAYIEALKTFSEIGVRLIFEPGRFLVGHAGLLIAQVRFIKETKDRNFLILDTGSHHLVRPMLYGAYHHILPFELKADRPRKTYDVVGPLCESSDFLAKGRVLPEMQEGEFVAILDAGAYGAVMANQYNLRAKPREIDLQSISI